MLCAMVASMKVFFVILLTFIFTVASGQEIAGKYEDFFGHDLELKNDSTFKFEWRFDLVYNWAIGNWSISNKVISLNIVDVYDTLVRTGEPDSLVLSIDPIFNSINAEQYAESQLISGGQYRDRFPTELKKKGERLYLIDQKYNIRRTRNKGIWPQKRLFFGYKKWPTYYRRTNE